MITKLSAALRKNFPPLSKFATGQLPKFVYPFFNTPESSVFDFHETDAETFDSMSDYLIGNGYSILNCDEWDDATKNGRTSFDKAVMLSFDDGHVSLYQSIFPILKEKNIKVVSFICPRLVSIISENESQKKRKLCNWSEIREMHQSGLVDFQSHSHAHDLIFRSSKLRGFYSSSFRSQYFGKSDNPYILYQNNDISLTNLIQSEESIDDKYFGTPIFDCAPRFDQSKRFIRSKELVAHFEELVARHGGASALDWSEWKGILKQGFENFRSLRLGEFSSGSEYQKELELDLSTSKHEIERALGGKEVMYFCPPWFRISEVALRAARNIGMKRIFSGVQAFRYGLMDPTHQPTIDGRLSNPFIYRLPGSGRRSFFSVIRTSFG